MQHNTDKKMAIVEFDVTHIGQLTVLVAVDPVSRMILAIDCEMPRAATAAQVVGELDFKKFFAEVRNRTCGHPTNLDLTLSTQPQEGSDL